MIPANDLMGEVVVRPVTRSAWLKGPQAPCDRSGASTRRLNLVLLGPPGVGKGTQGALLSARLGPCHLSTGDVFRVAGGLDPCERTLALNAAVAAIARGELASDETALNLVRERVGCFRCDGGFLLDGFPRTVPQAVALTTLLVSADVVLDAVVAFALPTDQVVARLAGRRVCPRCRDVYHVDANPPDVAGRCNACDVALERRDDDRPEVVRVRMQQYVASTPPLIDFYQHRGMLRWVDASGPPEQVFARTSAVLGLTATASSSLTS